MAKYANMSGVQPQWRELGSGGKRRVPTDATSAGGGGMGAWQVCAGRERMNIDYGFEYSHHEYSKPQMANARMVRVSCMLDMLYLYCLTILITPAFQY